MSQHPTDRPSSPGRTAGRTQQARPEAAPRRGTLPPYKVVLLPDPAVDLMFVVRTVMELTRLCRAEATHKMWEAHHSGR
jgi:ATP-dependent Clp protease adapter protein ClpS